MVVVAVTVVDGGRWWSAVVGGGRRWSVVVGTDENTRGVRRVGPPDRVVATFVSRVFRPLRWKGSVTF